MPIFWKSPGELRFSAYQLLLTLAQRFALWFRFFGKHWNWIFFFFFFFSRLTPAVTYAQQLVKQGMENKIRASVCCSEHFIRTANKSSCFINLISVRFLLLMWCFKGTVCHFCLKGSHNQNNEFRTKQCDGIVNWSKRLSCWTADGNLSDVTCNRRPTPPLLFNIFGNIWDNVHTQLN